MSMLKNFRVDTWPLVALAPLLHALNRSLRLDLHRSRSAGTDPATGFFDAHAFAARGSALVAQCMQRRQRVSLVVIRFDDFPEMQALFGAHLCQRAMARIARSLGKALPARAMAARTGAAEFALLFPQLSGQAALALLEKSLGTPMRFEFILDRTEVVLLPELAADVISASETLVQAHERLRDRLVAFTTSERARLESMAKQREHYARS